MTPSKRAAPPQAVADDTADAVSRFEQQLQELESIVAQVESGELALETSLQLFERGMSLASQCRNALDTAELRLKNLLERDSAVDPA